MAHDASAAVLDPYRLPTDIAPSRYDVRLRPDLGSATFDGTVTIAIEASQPAGRIVLNANELDVSTCLVDDVAAEFRLDTATERLVITPAVPLDAGQRARLDIEFSGELNDKLCGFYKSTYVDEHGDEQIVATTQMQATDCRRAFPCWDEPDFKAVFGITLDVADGLTAISNGPEVDRTSADGRTIVRFADTMVMSSYLVAFVVGRLEVTETVDVDGIPLRLVHVPGKGALTEFGLDCAAFCLRWFQEYYDIAYPSDKVDLIALPDFAAGAMENLGCITFRESLLLVDPDTSTQQEQQLVADVVAHELAHMWFGDLVTMRWWNGIWLNEAFATFMEIAACAAYRPDWERWTHFGLERTVAFEVDALESTRPVEFEVLSPTDAEGMFDVLTYQKGGALLRMLEQYLGAERFQEGVSHYLRTHSYANTETNDLWDAIEETSDEPVRRMMDSWIWQPGHPLVSASLDRGELVLSQQKFSFDTASSDDTVFVVPVHVRNGDVTSTVLLDSAGPTRHALDDPSAVTVVNAGSHGFYRVAYDDELRSRLGGSALAELSTLERYSLVDDAWSATVAGRLEAADLLSMIEGFGDERDLAVWQAIAIALRGLSRLVEGEALAALRARIAALVGPVLDDLGEPSTGDSDLTAKLRGSLTSVLGILGDDAATQARCRDVFTAARTTPGSADPELVAAATSVVAATGGEDDYEVMVDGFVNGATPQDQLRHLYALADFDDPELLIRSCEFAMTDQVKSQNAPFVLRLAIANRHHGRLAWEFVRDRWSDINERFPSNTIVRLMDGVKLLTEPDVVEETQTFFAEHPIEQALATMNQVLERQRVNAELRAREADRFAAALT
ncbi:MAG: M1 family metallopeptidase [Actinomycetota bacterium]